MAQVKNKAKVVTGVCRSSYMYILKLEHPRKKDGSEDKERIKEVRTQILIPKKDKATVAKIKKAFEFAAIKKFGKGVKLKSKKFGNPLRDGDEELKDGDKEGDHYKGHYFLNAKAYKVPQVAIDDDGEIVRVIEPDELSDIVCSGFFYKFSITMKGYTNESDGVRVELNNVMFVKEGDRLDGGTSAEDDFSGDDPDDVDDDDEDNDNDNEEIFEEIKEAYDEYIEENSKADAKKILKNYDIKKISDLSKVDEDELGDLLEELQDE